MSARKDSDLVHIRFMEGEIVYFRPLLRSDIRPEYLAWLNDPDMTSHSASFRVKPTTEKDLEEFVEGLGGQERIVFAACCKKTHRHFGNFSLATIDWVSRTAEASLMIGLPEFRTAHYLDGIDLLARFAFHTLNLNKIWGGTEIPSVPLLLERMGWQREGLLRQHTFRDGTYVDVVQLGLLRADFEDRLSDSAGAQG